MTQQRSFTKAENELLPKFRKMTNEAESTEDVKKFFVYCMQELISQVTDGRLELQFIDVELVPDGEPPYRFSSAVQAEQAFADSWEASDLGHIVQRFAELALRRYQHLQKNPQKTGAKIRN